MIDANAAPRSAGYDQGVDRLIGYLSSLPDRARGMWVEAAYEVYLADLRLDDPGADEDRSDDQN